MLVQFDAYDRIANPGRRTARPRAVNPQWFASPSATCQPVGQAENLTFGREACGKTSASGMVRVAGKEDRLADGSGAAHRSR